ncbi:MAG TPA: peroxiredoxin [Kofleriaceae bacterium]|nr:peroxiredoxin [Kofleriaceae bacterium]
MIQVGQKIPSLKLRKVTASGVDEVTTDDFFGGRKVVVFSVPGAFTPTCSSSHLPGYVANAENIKKRGVAEIACLSVNDAHVMRAWATAQNATSAVTMLADGNAELTRALGLDIDLAVAGMGVRGKRAALVVDDGVVSSVEVEAKPSDVTGSSAESCLVKLGA